MTMHMMAVDDGIAVSLIAFELGFSDAALMLDGVFVVSSCAATFQPEPSLAGILPGAGLLCRGQA